MIQEHTGAFRLKLTPIAGGAQIQFIDEATGETIWQQGCTPPEGCSAVLEIKIDGKGTIVPGYVVDQEGLRHFHMRAETAVGLN